MTRPRQILKDSIALLRNGWTKGCMARDANGKECGPLSGNAVAWCAEGAIMVASNGERINQDEAWKLFHDAVGIGRFESAADWNDEQKSAKPVIAAMKKAIKAIK